ncbi:helix-turn-helix domain-containing protein [Paenibacillus cisolokensis]|uniref:helix-turn-helix domain-containing protein n=1 Tax=Paenibacillus cisolokensis TaxID=1658519 RepID=UPI0027DD2EB0|nr:helix-turn-helix domain-containing protein [Paenibacillus cisolokensis]
MRKGAAMRTEECGCRFRMRTRLRRGRKRKARAISGRWRCSGRGTPSKRSRARGLSKVTVEGHIIRCAEEGHAVDWERIVPPDREQQILDTVRALGADRLRPIKDALPDDIPYFAIHGVICKYGLRRG